jgi:hypothetical protein
MNVPEGFTDGFSFFYSAASVASVTAYDDVDGSGNILATLNLAVQSDNGCVGDFCNWSPVSVSFSGNAKSGKSIEGKLRRVHLSTLTIIGALT